MSAPSGTRAGSSLSHRIATSAASVATSWRRPTGEAIVVQAIWGMIPLLRIFGTALAGACAFANLLVAGPEVPTR